MRGVFFSLSLEVELQGGARASHSRSGGQCRDRPGADEECCRRLRGGADMHASRWVAVEFRRHGGLIIFRSSGPSA